MPWTVMPKTRSADRRGVRRDDTSAPAASVAKSRARRWGVRATLVTIVAILVAVVVGTLPEQASAHVRVTPPQIAPKPAATLHAVVHSREIPRRTPHARPLPPGPSVHPHARPRGSTPITITVVEVTTAAGGQAAVNRCAGPVEVQYGRWGYPNDIIQHDYCGGAWMAFIRAGTRIRIVGGTEPGLYVANGNRRLVPKDSRVSFLQGIGDVALQTCEGSQLALIGLTRIA